MTAAALQRWFAEPTLQRRSVTHVLLAFVLVWAAILTYMYVQRERTNANDPPFQKFAAAMASSLEGIQSVDEAVAVVRATEQWLNIRRKEIGVLPGHIKFELLDARGTRLYASAALQGTTLNALRPGVTRIELHGEPHHYYGAKRGSWELRIVETVRTGGNFLAYNSTFILQYLLLAIPFVVIPVWLSIRSGLKPLQLFAAKITDRNPDDLRPIGYRARHRELKPLAAAIDSLLERLRQRFDRERLFVQDAAHEIRTPLAVVSTQAHVMAHASSTEERLRAYGLLNQSIARASHLAQQLLLLATLDDVQRGAPRHIDVAQAVRELLAQAAPLAMARGIELSLEAPDHLPCPVDEPAFASIVMNLVDNAIRYGREGGNVVVTLKCDEERLMLQVQDDGPGIPEGEHALVFERFYRCAGEETPGTGLGLAIVRQAALRMGGRALVTAGLAKRGVGFLVSLPIPGFVAR
jgi:two-component system sensor histidine kinase QseC